MKRIFFLLTILIAWGCDKRQLAEPNFSVEASSLSVATGDTIKFTFHGNPDFITFYPGTTGFNYRYKDRIEVEGNVRLQFTSQKQYGSQLNSLQLLVTSELPDYSVTGIEEASWTDITSRATLSEGENNVPSGAIDLSDLLIPAKPIYIAFRKVDGEELVPNTWTIRNLIVDVMLDNGSTLPVATLANAGWRAVDVFNPLYYWTVTSASLRCTGGRNNPVNEDWVISSPLYPLQVAPDFGIPIKSSADNYAGAFEYVFEDRGTYEVYFVGVNVLGDERREVVRSLTIQVNE